MWNMETSKTKEQLQDVSDDPVYASFSNHVFIFLSVITNRFGRNASAYFRRRYGIGIVEWRIIAVLGFQSPLSSQELAQRTDVDKAAVSRSLRSLEALELIRLKRTGSSSPRKLIYITDKGREIRERAMEDTLRRQEMVFADLDPEKLATFREVLKYLFAKTEETVRYYPPDRGVDGSTDKGQSAARSAKEASREEAGQSSP